jgi:hypothetical protein
MVIKGAVKKKGENKTIVKHEMENFSVAPNSKIGYEHLIDRFVIDLIRLLLSNREFFFSFPRPPISLSTKVNDETVYKVLVPDWVPWVALGLIIALIGLIAYFLKADTYLILRFFPESRERGKQGENRKKYQPFFSFHIPHFLSCAWVCHCF